MSRNGVSRINDDKLIAESDVCNVYVSVILNMSRSNNF